MKKINSKISYYLLACLPGLLLFLVTLFPTWWLIGLLAIFPLILALHKAPDNLLTKLFFISGFSIIGLSMVWVFETLSYDWLNIGNFLPGFIGGLLFWLNSSLIGGLTFLPLAFLWKRLKTGTNFDILLFSSLWVIFEFIRAVLASIILIGKGTIIGPHWTIGSLGYSLSLSPWIAIWSGWGGLYLLSFIAVAFSFSVYQLIIVNRNHKVIISLWLFFLLFSTISLMPIQLTNKQQFTPRPQIEVIVFRNDHKTNLTAPNFELKNKTGANLPTILLFPEDYRFLKTLELKNSSDEKLISHLSDYFNYSNLLIIDSMKIKEAGKNKMKMIYADLSNDNFLLTEKVLLSPFGEYLPTWINKMAHLMKLNKWLSDYQNNRAVVVGKVFQPIDFGQEKISILFCGEAFSSALYRQQVKNGATIIGNASSQLFIGGSKILSQQTQAAAILRATENRRFFILSAVINPAFILNPQGQVIDKTEVGQFFIQKTIQTEDHFTLYTLWGNWILLLAFFILFLSFLRSQSFPDKIP
ncbi:MAG TPA: hypothetical protein PKN73_01710 [Candidatus Paceibacterota bacterium]|nr:hypothetical protein [Candidatus Paceibacterota bacterium]HQC46333.1 hypothetical protein [Candidatus Paceibacterota bacterium]